MRRLLIRNGPARSSRSIWRHGVDVVLDIVDAAGRGIGDVLKGRMLCHGNADVLVMGAYGHSRIREFILGGATRRMLSRAPLPILFSH